MIVKQKSVLKPLKITSSYAFTIVELLIVIVIIGILASITIVSYNGIMSKANQASLQSDLATAKKQMELYKVDHGEYPTGLDGSNCLTGNISPSPDNKHCLKSSNSASFTLTGGGVSDYSLKLTKGDIAYVVTNTTTPTLTTATAITFAKAWGGSSGDYTQDIIKTADGDYATVGYTDSFGAGSSDVFISKYDTYGNLSWSRTWGGASSDQGFDLIQTSDGGYAITGQTTSYGVGVQDVFLIKYDTSGNLSWSKTWGGAGNDYAYSLVQTSDSGYAITGYTNSYGASNADAFLAKYDASGNLSWSRTWGGTGNDYGRSLVQAPDGGYAISGHTTSFGAGLYDAFLAKYDASGNLSWSRTWGGTGYDYNQSGLIQTADGGYAIPGHTTSFGAGSYDVFLIKYDASGNLSWNKTWGGAGSDTNYGGLIKTADGGYAMSGNTTTYGAGSDDVFLIKYDASGNLSWNKTWGGSSNDTNYGGLVQTVDGGYAMSGYTISFGAGNYDAFILKTNSSGVITNCNVTMCQSPTATVTSPTATVTSPTATVTSPSATTTSPSATITSPSATSTTIVAP